MDTSSANYLNERPQFVYFLSWTPYLPVTLTNVLISCNFLDSLAPNTTLFHIQFLSPVELTTVRGWYSCPVHFTPTATLFRGYFQPSITLKSVLISCICRTALPTTPPSLKDSFCHRLNSLPSLFRVFAR